MYGDSYGRTRSKKPLFIGIGIVAVIGIIIAVVAISLSNRGEKKEISHDLVELQATVIEYKDSVEYYEEAFDRAFEESGYRIYQPELSSAFYEKEKEELTSNFAKYEEFRKKLDNFAEIEAIDTTGKTIKVDNSLAELKRVIDKKMTFYKEFKDVNTLVLDVYINEGNEATLSALKNYSDKTDLQLFAESLQKYYQSRKPIKNELNNNNCEKDFSNIICINANRKLMKLRSDFMDEDINAISTLLKTTAEKSKTDYSPAVLMDNISRMQIVVKDEE
jgi:hypothetical protein